MANSTTESNVGAPSLQELALNETLAQVLQPDFSDFEFADLEPRLQQLLFQKMRAEINRLREVENDYSQLPHADKQAHAYITTLWDHERIKNDLEFDSDLVELEDKFRGKWTRVEDPDGEVLEESEEGVSWTTRNLHTKALDSDLEICDCRPSSSSESKPCRYTLGLRCRISSQLLLYRLVATFGTILHDDDEALCWNATFKFNGDSSSALFMYDWNGTARVIFCGTSEASNEALKLLNHLVKTDWRQRF